MVERRKKTTRLTVSVDEVDYAKPNIITPKSDGPLWWAIRQAIRRFVREHDIHPELSPRLAEQVGRPEASGC